MTGRRASISCGPRFRNAAAARRPPGRWSACCCSAASTTPEVVELAVRGALAAGAHDGRAVKLLVDRTARPQPPAVEIDARLAGIGQPPPTDDLAGYDQLRDQEAGR